MRQRFYAKYLSFLKHLYFLRRNENKEEQS